MATKALLYSADRLSSEQIKESHCKTLVRQLLAIAIGKRIYQRIIVKAAEDFVPKPFIPEQLPSHKTPGTSVSGPLVEKSAINRFRIMQANQIGGRKAFKIISLSEIRT